MKNNKLTGKQKNAMPYNTITINTIQLIQHNTSAITREREMDDDHDVVGEGDADNLEQMFPVSIYTTK